ncbi:MAG: hypothetical protein VX252_14175 [Myxococcota bacterium]|nr:hypothetical protein [Myxococcota bacterium]
MSEIVAEGEEGESGARTRWVRPLALACVLLAYAWLQLADLGHPLFWQDEGETAMLGQRVLEYGYPKVHGETGVVFGVGVPMSEAVDAETDAYLGSFWGQYYLAALGVALSQGATDPYVRTAWVRAPFIVAGLLGLGLLWWAVQPALAGRRRARLDSAILFGVLLCLSVSLMLHLREARYYGPALGLIGAGVALELRVWRSFGSSSPGRSFGLAALSLVVLLLLLNFFFPAAVAMAGWWTLERVWAFFRSPRAVSSPAQVGWPLGVVLVVWALAGLVLMQAFGISRTAGILSERWDFGFSLYLENLAHLVFFLARYEWLIPCLLAELGLFALVRQVPGRTGEGDGVLATRAALYRFCFLYAALGAANPIFFERYFVPLGPILALVLVLDLEVLRRRITGVEPEERRRRLQWVGALALALVFLILVGVRGPELRGRLAEIQDPAEGPVDASVLFVASRWSDPSTLTIATNYEMEPFMFYLGSRVVGRFHDGTPEEGAWEAAVKPDLVIPRMAQPRSLGAVRRYLLEGEFKRNELNVADTEYNQIPELYSGRVLSTVHHFETQRPGDAGPPVAVYERLDRP